MEFKNNKPGKYQRKPGSQSGKYNSNNAKPYNRDESKSGDRPKPYNRGENSYGDKTKTYNRGENKNYSDKPKPYNRDDNRSGDRPKPYNRGENKFGDRPQSKNFSRDNDNRFKKPSFPSKNNQTDGGQKKYNNYKSNDKKTFSKKDGFVKIHPTKIADNIPEPAVKDENIVCGRNAVLELIKSGRTIDKIFIQKNNKEGSLKLIFAEALKTGITLVEAEKSKLDDLNAGSSHQGVVAFASQKEYCTLEDILEIAKQKNEKPFIVIADKIMDPHNLGAIIRSAECAGAHGLIIPKRHAVGISSVVAKSSAGAVEHLAIAKVANLTNAVEELKKLGVWIFSSYSSEGENEETKEIKDYNNIDFDLPCALILGNEGDGISTVLTEKSDFLIKIPMYGLISSLNVSCAAAVLMFKIKENRLGAKQS